MKPSFPNTEPAGQGGAAVATTFPDRWGVPVQGASQKAVALLDEAVEQRAARKPTAEPAARALVAANTPEHRR